MVSYNILVQITHSRLEPRYLAQIVDFAGNILISMVSQALIQLNFEISWFVHFVNTSPSYLNITATLPLLASFSSSSHTGTSVAYIFFAWKFNSISSSTLAVPSHTTHCEIDSLFLSTAIRNPFCTIPFFHLVINRELAMPFRSSVISGW